MHQRALCLYQRGGNKKEQLVKRIWGRNDTNQNTRCRNRKGFFRAKDARNWSKIS